MTKTRLSKRELEYLLDLLDLEKTKWENGIETEADRMAETKKRLRMIQKIRLAVIDLDRE